MDAVARNTFHTAPSSAAIQCKIQSVIFHFGIQDILQCACCGQHRKIFPFFYAPGIFGLEIIILYYILFKVLLPVLQPAQMLGTEPGYKASIFNVVTPKGIWHTGYVNVHFQSRRPCERLFILKMRRGHDMKVTPLSNCVKSSKTQ